ncbi:hypothetical protein H2200_003557 [Cladophialophora chaetospira]|uniref:Uncharacterized protein n=1 Tax=Cladophialophora chaetospira TaxID=386627 RepID=A0AA39CKU7_9EURO|nr:hypothetical protein H2200_003557 [Cladophialophora chaetospira]
MENNLENTTLVGLLATVFMFQTSATFAKSGTNNANDDTASQAKIDHEAHSKICLLAEIQLGVFEERWNRMGKGKEWNELVAEARKTAQMWRDREKDKKSLPSTAH